MSVLKATKKLDLIEERKNISRIIGLRESMVNYWSERGLDAVLVPSFPCPPVLPSLVEHLTLNLCYAFIWNLYDFVAGVLPVTRVQPEE